MRALRERRNGRVRLWLPVVALGIALVLYGLSSGRAQSAAPVFSDIATPAMAEAEVDSHGGCWGDYDRDGDQDLFVANYLRKREQRNRLWRNEGNGTFTERAAPAGLASPHVKRVTGCAFADLDNDGDLDLYLTSKNNRQTDTPAQENKLYRNNGDGTFTDATGAAGVGMRGSGAASVDWADLDRDGDHDGFVATRLAKRPHRVNALYVQTRPLVFRNMAAATGLADPEGPQNAFLGAWFDYDADGDLDLLLAIDYWGVELYANDGGAFVRVTPSVFPPATDDTPGAAPDNAMGVAIGDYDNDGCFDFYVTGMNMAGETPRAASDVPSRLYRSDCRGHFTDATRAAGLKVTGVAEWGTNFIDYDNDGDLDLSVVAGNPEPKNRLRGKLVVYAGKLSTMLVSAGRAVIPERVVAWAYRYEIMIPPAGTFGRTAAMPNFLYRNQLVESGVARFVNVTHAVGAANVGAARGSAWADMDNDGDLDWFIPNRGTPNRLFRNNGPVGHYLRVHLVGARLRDAVGAWVKITVGAGLQVRHVHILDGYLSQSQLDPHFGLGAAERVEEVWVRWPGETRWVLACRGVPANRTITVQEGVGCR